MSGYVNPMSLSNISFNSKGTTGITAAKLYSTENRMDFTNPALLNTLNNAVGGVFNFSFPLISMTEGTYYF
jgi:hypothetical protein